MKTMIAIKVSKLRVTVIPKVAKVIELRMALEAKAIRKKIATERKLAPMDEVLRFVPVWGDPVRFAPGGGYPRVGGYPSVGGYPYIMGGLLMKLPLSWE